MNEITKHIPDFVDFRSKLPSVEFETVEQLLAIDWVGSWANDLDDPVFCKEKVAASWWLMIDGHKEGRPWWWVIGHLKNGEVIDLPVWNYETRKDLHSRRSEP